MRGWQRKGKACGWITCGAKFVALLSDSRDILAYINQPLEARKPVGYQRPAPKQADVQALLIEELRRLHEGVLARYGLRQPDYVAWLAVHGRG